MPCRSTSDAPPEQASAVGPARVLVVHNRYQQRGGEDAVVDAEIDLLRFHGHAVAMLERHNDEIANMGIARVGIETLWSHDSVRRCRSAIADFQPDVIHVHNTFPLVSPAIYWVAADAGIPVIQTLHNFRLLCPQAMLLRDGRVCEDCVGHVPWRAAVHGCYRGSRMQTALIAAMLTLHQAPGTWQRKVTRYIALNEFCKQIFIAGGLPANRICVKPNFIDLAPAKEEARQGGLYVGRLAPEKGIALLLTALDRLQGMTLRFAGDGPAMEMVKAHGGGHWLGPLAPSEVFREMRRAAYLVIPSLCYENFPRVLVEAYASGLPVIASRLGAMAELIDDGRTGLLFDAGNPADLTEKLRWAEANPEALADMGRAARQEHEKKYTGEINHSRLAEIYHEAMLVTRARSAQA